MTVIRKAIASDIPSLKKVLTSIELFPSEMLDDMMADYLHDDNSGDIWLTVVIEDVPVGLAYCAPEKLTEGTYNLHAIGVKADLQGIGLGSAIITQIEKELTLQGQRLLIVDTSGTAAYDKTRDFYTKLGYRQEAVIRDFWADGDDKITFTKGLKEIQDS